MEAPTTAEASMPQENRPQLQKYKSPDGVEVGVAKFHVEGSNPKKAVVYCVGWPFRAEDPTTWPLAVQLTKGLKETCFSIDTAAARGDKNALAVQGKAIGQFVIDQGIEDVTLVGFSVGAVKAAHTAFALQNNPSSKIKINGLVLIDPTGLGQRSTLGLIKDIVKDAGVAQKEKARRGIRAGDKGPAPQTVPPAEAKKDLLGNLGRILKSGKLGIPLLWSQRRALKDKDSIYAKLGNIPVWIIAGGKDKVSNYEKYLLPDKEARKLAALPEPGMENFRAQKDMADLARVRSRIAQLRHFGPETPVKVSVTNRLGQHGGVVDLRGGQVGRILATGLKK